MRRVRAIAILTAAMALTVVPGAGHEHATGIVKERMDNMEAMAKRMKAITDRLKARRDLAAIAADARAVQELSAHVAHQFPPGSTQAPTDAKSAIWRNWPDFEAKAKAAEIASEKLANTDAADVRALSAQARALTQACGDCHELYRVRR